MKDIRLGYLTISRYTTGKSMNPSFLDRKEKVNPLSVVLPMGDYKLKINYPVSRACIVELKVGLNGMTRTELAGFICKSYRKMYKDDDKAKGQLYGIWGHDIGDLMLGSAQVNDENVITCGVDS